MRTWFFMLAAVALSWPATSPAQAKSDMQCSREARQVTGELDGLEFTQAKTACLLEPNPWVAVGRNPVAVQENPTPEVEFSTSRRVSSGIWVRVSPNRWVLKPH